MNTIEERLTVVDVQKGDVLVVRIPDEHCTFETAARYKRAITEALKEAGRSGVPVIVTGHSVQIEAIRALPSDSPFITRDQFGSVLLDHEKRRA